VRQPTGTVVRIDPCGEFGLESADGLAFAEEMGEKGPQASTLKLPGKHKLR
jgi:hypothetical protein